MIATVTAIAEIRTGRFSEAQVNLLTGVDMSELAGSPANTCETLIWVAHWLEHLDRHVEAAQLCGGLNSILTSIGFKPQHAEQEAISRIEAACRKAVGKEPFEIAYREGQGLGLPQTVASARLLLADEIPTF